MDIKTTVTAHRGASDRYPENTMSAFRGAKELGADWIELDVLQTKDQQLVIAHDNNLKRITGDKKVKITKSTYEELLKYDFGLYKGEEFRDEKIPLLSQALEYARDNNIKLNIELKPKGQEVNFEQSILDMIYQYDMQDRCVVTSINYKAVKKIRELDKNIKVVYVMPIAIGDFYKDDTVDAFSIEVSFVNEKVVEEIHKRGKEIYVWTIDDEETMNNMIALGVDSIITNNIELANKLIDEKKHTNLLEEFVKKMLELS